MWSLSIKELCIIRNIINNNTVIVGNCCVKKFLGLSSDKIFQSVKRIRKNIEKSLNEESIQYAFQHKIINDWEKDFYLNIMKKRKLTDKQSKIKKEINSKFLNRIKKS